MAMGSTWKDECPWIYGLSTDENPGCQDRCMMVGVNFDDIPEEEMTVPRIGVPVQPSQWLVPTIHRPKRREDEALRLR